MKQTLVTLPRAYWYLWGGTLVNRLGMVILPFLSIYLTIVLHLSANVVGLIMALPGVGSILASLLISAISDHLDRKYLLVALLIISAVLLLILPFLASLALLTLIVLAWSIASEAQRPLSTILTMDLVGENLRRQAISFLRLAINAGTAVSMSLGGIIMSIAFLPLFVADAGTTLLFAVVILLFLPHTFSTISTKLKVGWSAQRGSPLTPFRVSEFRRLWLTGLCTTIILSQQFTIFGVYLTRLGGSPVLYGGLMGLSSLLIILLEFPLTAMLQYIAASRVIALGCLALALAAVLCGLISVPSWLLLPIVAFTFGEMIFSPPYDILGAELAPPEQLGSYTGMFWLATGLGFALGPALGGVLLQISASIAWFVMGGIGLLAAALAWTTPMKSAENKPGPENYC